MNNSNMRRTRVRDLTYISFSTVLIILSAWIKIPFVIPFTLQTFGIAFAVILLGGKRAFISILLYIILGAIGLPVFSGFTGGIGILFGSTGGYILGFLFLPLLAWLFSLSKKTLKHSNTIALFLGQLLCYILGTVWYLLLYADSFTLYTLLSIVSICVLPFILPDAAKLLLAHIVANKLKKYIK